MSRRYRTPAAALPSAPPLHEQPRSPRAAVSSRHRRHRGGIAASAAPAMPAAHSAAPRPNLRRRRDSALPLLRVHLIAALILLIAVSIASYRDVEQLMQDQRALNSAYALRARLQDAQMTVREAQTAQAAFLRTGSPSDHWYRDDRLAVAQHTLAAIPNPSVSALLAGTPTDAAYPEALSRVRQAAERETMSITARASRVEIEAAREREYVWVRTCGMIALLGVAFLLFWRDTAQRERQEQELRLANRTLTRLAEQDGLTRLKNRRALEERMRAEWGRCCRSGDPLSLVFVDVDRFKQYNDSFGHIAGDEVLRQVADLLKRESRASDFVARYGGEEFAVLLPRTGESESRRVAEHLRASFETAVWPGRSVTASVGVATLSPDTADALDTLLYEADVALYFAKHNGRNLVAHADEVVKIK